MPGPKPRPEAPSDLETLANRVRFVLFVRDMGLNELTKALGKGEGYVSRLLSEGRQPRADTAALLARVLGVPASWLVDGEKPKISSPHDAAYLLRATVRRANFLGGELAGYATFRMAFGVINAFEPASEREDGWLVPIPELRRLAPRMLLAGALAGPEGLHPSDEDQGGREFDVGLKIADAFLEFWRIDPGDVTIAGVHVYLEFAARSLRTATHLQVDQRRAIGTPLMIKLRPEWAHAEATARRLYPYVPEECIEGAGTIRLPIRHPLDGQLVGDVARSLYEASLRERARVREVIDRAGGPGFAEELTKTFAEVVSEEPGAPRDPRAIKAWVDGLSEEQASKILDAVEARLDEGDTPEAPVERKLTAGPRRAG